MYQARLKYDGMLCQYRFGSNSFKWVYYASVKFARHLLHKDPDIGCVIIRIDEDIIIAVGQSGLTIDTRSGVYEIDKVGV